MKKYFTEELKRIIFRKIFFKYLLACNIFLIVTVIGDITDGIGIHDYLPLFTYSTFMSVLYIILPLWVAIPYALSYANERDSGLKNIILTKMSKKDYMLTKYFVNAIVSALSIFVPFTLWYIIIIFFTGFDIKGKGISVEMLFCGELFLKNPFLYGVFIIINSTVCAIVLSTFCLGFTAILKNKIIAFIMPFVIYIFSGIVLAMVDARLDLTRMFSLWNRGNTPLWQLVAYEFFWFICGTVMYFVGYKVNEHDR